MGAESEKGGQGQCVWSSQSPEERVGRMEGVAEPGKPQPGSAFSAWMCPIAFSQGRHPIRIKRSEKQKRKKSEIECFYNIHLSFFLLLLSLFTNGEGGSRWITRVPVDLEAHELRSYCGVLVIPLH